MFRKLSLLAIVAIMAILPTLKIEAVGECVPNSWHYAWASGSNSIFKTSTVECVGDESVSTFKYKLNESPLFESTPSFEAYDFAWSPDGTQIAFIGRTEVKVDAELYLMNADGTDIQVVTNYEMTIPGQDSDTYTQNRASSPVWSPDGTKIALTLSQSQQFSIAETDGAYIGPSMIFTYDMTTGSLDQYYREEEFCHIRAGVWNENGIYSYKACMSGDDPHVILISAPMKSNRVTENRVAHGDTWTVSPDGTKIAYTVWSDWEDEFEASYGVLLIADALTGERLSSMVFGEGVGLADTLENLMWKGNQHVFLLHNVYDGNIHLRYPTIVDTNAMSIVTEGEPFTRYGSSFDGWQYYDTAGKLSSINWNNQK